MSRLILVILLAPCIAACPLPIRHTETLSAPVVGIVRGPDERPVENVPVAVVSGYRGCTDPELRDTTDAAGTFSLPAHKKTYSLYWVVPNLDRTDPAYSICVGTGDTIVAAYTGRGSLQGDVPLDSITCVQWSWRNRPRANCSGSIERSLVSGGRWIEGEGEAIGRYRIILTRDDSTTSKRRQPRYGRPFVLVVQWLEQPDPNGPVAVRTAVELRLDKNVEWAGELSLAEVFGRWCASIETTRLTHTLYWENHKQEVITFRLGPPGHARQVPGC